jgi:hypothetical protein
MEQPVSNKDLRSFGLLVGAVFGAIGIWPLLFRGEPMRLSAVGVGGTLIALGGVLPRVLAPIHKIWMSLGHMLGWINTRILLGLVFYVLVTPIGIIFRLMGKDTMRKAFVRESPTYRVLRKPRPRGHMKYQF